MARYDAYNSECVVFAFKEGLLARLGHDLKIRVERFSIELDETTLEVRGTFDPSSLRVQSACVHGQEDTSLLDGPDKQKIDDCIANEVLEPDKHPTIEFESAKVTQQGNEYVLEGQLQLCGQCRPIRVHVRPQNDRWVAEAPVHQPDFGIKPFAAALGGLKVKPGVQIRVSVPR